MRVIAGSARSMPLRTVKGMDVRPTTDRTKETLFNMIQFRIPDCRFLDLYAGSGSIGIEALSRGASRAVFVEKDRRTQKLINENLTFTKLADRAELIGGDVLSVLPRLAGGEPFDIIFMDPPFNHGLEKETLLLLERMPDLLAPDGLVIAEADPKTDFSWLPGTVWNTVSHKIYSRSSHLFLERIHKS
ncbi:MAG: 16S rRNA (guanine(966)-N(2))-methyltransferase RsmD [Lachnospiraceae bacterium]|nr:16S rRNA (guanine(966)-N(2))-methyltransferase RsmD [Lachnospiraceae bacterium]